MTARAHRDDGWQPIYTGKKKNPRMHDYELAGNPKDYVNQVDYAVPAAFRRVMTAGRVSIAPFLRYHGLETGDELAVTLWDDGILISRADMYCELCRKFLEEKDEYTVFRNRLVCNRCIEEVKENGTLKGTTHTRHDDTQV